MVSNLVAETMDEDSCENLPDIEGLAEIICKVAKKHVGYTATDLMATSIEKSLTKAVYPRK